MWSDSENLCASAQQAGKKLGKYKKAATEAKRFPKRWKLDDHLGGVFLKPPSAFGTLVVSASGYRLEVDGHDATLRTFGEAVGSSSKQRPKRNNQHEALNLKTCRQKKLRADNRRTLRGSRTLKKPASQVRQVAFSPCLGSYICNRIILFAACNFVCVTMAIQPIKYEYTCT